MRGRERDFLCVCVCVCVVTCVHKSESVERCALSVEEFLARNNSFLHMDVWDRRCCRTSMRGASHGEKKEQ